MSGARAAGNRHSSVMTRQQATTTLRAMDTRERIRSNSAPEWTGTEGGAGPRADAVRDVAGLAPGLVPFGMALGIVIAASSMGDAAGVLGAPLIYGGSAQL